MILYQYAMRIVL